MAIFVTAKPILFNFVILSMKWLYMSYEVNEGQKFHSMASDIVILMFQSFQSLP